MPQQRAFDFRRQLATDSVSADIMQRHNIPGRPLVTPGDGNCLFHASSLVLTGTLCLSSELRCKVTLMMVLRPDQVKNTHHLLNDLLLVSPRNEEAALSRAGKGQYSCSLTNPVLVAGPLCAKSKVSTLPKMVRGIKFQRYSSS